MASRASNGRTVLRGGAFLGLVISIAIATATGCGETFAACYEGDFVACSCDDGARGFKACNPSLDGYGACFCDGTTPGVDAGRAPLDAGREGGDGGGRNKDGGDGGEADASSDAAAGDAS